jgi:hypothetical protein
MRIKTFQERTQELDALRRKALKDGDLIAYATYNRVLGIPPEQEDAHHQGIESGRYDTKKVEELEKKIDETLYGKKYVNQKKKIAEDTSNENITQKIDVDIKKYKNFGIAESKLSELPYMTLHKTWYGANNFNCPELYKNMNPAEIIGLLVGIGSKDDTFQKIIDTEKSKRETLADIVSNIVSKTVSRGYEISAEHMDEGMDLKTLAKNTKKNPYSAKAGEMKERIRKLPTALHEEIYKQLTTEPYKYITDPNSDGESKRSYAFRIMNHIKDAYAHISSNT